MFVYRLLVVVEADEAVPGVPADVDGLASVEERRVEHVVGEVRLDQAGGGQGLHQAVLADKAILFFAIFKLGHVEYLSMQVVPLLYGS